MEATLAWLETVIFFIDTCFRKGTVPARASSSTDPAHLAVSVSVKKDATTSCDFKDFDLEGSGPLAQTAVHGDSFPAPSLIDGTKRVLSDITNNGLKRPTRDQKYNLGSAKAKRTSAHDRRSSNRIASRTQSLPAANEMETLSLDHDLKIGNVGKASGSISPISSSGSRSTSVRSDTSSFGSDASSQSQTDDQHQSDVERPVEGSRGTAERSRASSWSAGDGPKSSES